MVPQRGRPEEVMFTRRRSTTKTEPVVDSGEKEDQLPDAGVQELLVAVGPGVCVLEVTEVPSSQIREDPAANESHNRGSPQPQAAVDS